MDYKDLAAILLGAAALLITVLGVFVAVLAVWGYTQFEKMAKDTTKEFIGLQLREGDLRRDIEALVSKHLAETEIVVREELSRSVMLKIEKDFSEGNIRSMLEERLDLALYGGAAQRAVSDEEFDDE